VIAGVDWISRNKDAWIARGTEVMTEGRNFGRKTDNQGCVDESISRYKKEPGLTATISNGLFMRGCLDSSRPTRGFCDDVPRQTEFMKTVQWRISQGRRFDVDKETSCQNRVARVPQLCEAKTQKSD